VLPQDPCPMRVMFCTAACCEPTMAVSLVQTRLLSSPVSAVRSRGDDGEGARERKRERERSTRTCARTLAVCACKVVRTAARATCMRLTPAPSSSFFRRRLYVVLPGSSTFSDDEAAPAAALPALSAPDACQPHNTTSGGACSK
jgi:hypothetical protein